MYLTLLALPLSCFICLALFGRFLGTRGSALLSVFSAVCCTVISCFIFYEVALCACPCHILLGPFFFSELYDASWGFLFDTLSAVMCLVVTLVSCLVIIFSCSYMIQDPHFVRFLSYLKLFTVAMLILVTADNYIQLFVGWEGVGLASFLLISFWFTRLQASKAAIQAMLLNRVGDIGLALGVICLFYMYKTTNYQVIFASATNTTELLIIGPFSINLLDLACILLFVGAMGKSGQFGLHAWLPEAMNAPTPVSALLHAATMVTAGVFLLARSSPLLEYTPTARAWITIIGAITCIFAGTIGLVQNDLKRIIAYSTCSQLGYMVTTCGASNYAVGIFHLFNHAFFKALLFLSAGALIHALANEQDIRKYGGLTQILVLSYTFVIIGSLALIGTPFLTGFYSKDVILELAAARYALNVHFSYLLATFSVLTTSYYSFRLIFFCFNSYFYSSSASNSKNSLSLSSKDKHINPGKLPNLHLKSIQGAHDPDWVMSLPLILLALGSIYAGWLFKEMFIGIGTDFWNNAIFVNPQNANLIEAEFLPQSIKLLPIFLTVAGGFLAFIFNLWFVRRSYLSASGWYKQVYMFLNKRWLYDKLLNDLVAYPSYISGFSLIRNFDKGFLELLPIAPLGLGDNIKKLYIQLGEMQSGLIFHYAVIMILSAVCFFTVLTCPEVFMITDSRVIAILFISLALV
uniref:NADH dehydrogenase subunit 5 n=1 Tax=Gayralia brasiliensis TaxID=1286870 RepID=UPI00241186E9|nr:NADH dehydrogenase subunit 5 [Gayralia brasiliensis]YP_010733816.1 NADH dehydrogenase subunit 5 [Monostroma nitidum]WEG93058.1 NADH dehydrogenase subunit 5 [Gayralia brasiliensis]WEG93087.1 NADH dehydrogenase subunit 5 [Monostroma nitidum]